MKILSAPRRWIMGALIVSMGLNMFLAGFILSRPHFGPPPHHDPDRFMAGLVDRAARTLPEADARILRDTFEAHRHELASAHEDRDGIRRRVQAALKAEPFSPEALFDISMQTKQARTQFEMTVDKYVIGAVTAMSPEGRRRLADFFD